MSSLLVNGDSVNLQSCPVASGGILRLPEGCESIAAVDGAAYEALAVCLAVATRLPRRIADKPVRCISRSLQGPRCWERRCSGDLGGLGDFGRALSDGIIAHGDTGACPTASTHLSIRAKETIILSARHLVMHGRIDDSRSNLRGHATENVLVAEADAVHSRKLVIAASAWRSDVFIPPLLLLEQHS